MNNPLWYELIETMKQRNQISFGLTIPYLIGSYRLSSMVLHDDFGGILELLRLVSSSDMAMNPVLKHCGDIGQYVVGLESKEFCSSYYSKELKFSNHLGNNTLYVTSNAASILGTTLVDIADSLFEKYKFVLEAETYCWKVYGRVWKPFDNGEIELIKSLSQL